MPDSTLPISAPIVNEVQYRDIPDWPGYRAGDDGSVLSCRIGGHGCGAMGTRWRRLKRRPDKHGYASVTLYRLDGTVRVFRISTLVLTVFVGPCPPGMEAAHNNGKSSEDRLSNLRWDTHANNLADKKTHGTEMQGESHYKAILNNDAVRYIRKAISTKTASAKELAAQFGVKPGTVYDIWYRRAWKHVAD